MKAPRLSSPNVSELLSSEIDLAAWSRRFAPWLPFVIFAAVTCLIFWRVFVYPPDILHEDLATQYHPWFSFANAEIQAGRFPLWNPYVAMGIPFHASLQPALLYPLRWPMFFMDFVPGMVILLMLHYFFTAVAGYYMIRGVMQVGMLGAILGSLTFAFGGFSLGHATHPTFFMGYPWFLLSILFIWRASENWNWRDVALGGVCLGMMGLIGSVHLMLILSMPLAAFFLFRLGLDLGLLIKGRLRPGTPWPNLHWSWVWRVCLRS